MPPNAQPAPTKTAPLRRPRHWVAAVPQSKAATPTQQQADRLARVRLLCTSGVRVRYARASLSA